MDTIVFQPSHHNKLNTHDDNSRNQKNCKLQEMETRHLMVFFIHNSRCF